VDFMDRSITIRRSKTDAGERVIPLNADAWQAILQLRERSKALFGDSLSLDWYVFPRAEGFYRPDPALPMGRGGCRTAWRRLTRAVRCPICDTVQEPADICCDEECKADIRGIKSPLAGLRFHDLRHHAITELAESQASDQTIRSIAGHVSEKMLEHYSHIRLDAKRTALDALSTGGKAVSYDTNDGTKRDSDNQTSLQDAGNIGGREGARTPDLLVANEDGNLTRRGAATTYAFRNRLRLDNLGYRGSS
jgi:hypothetical protein